MVRYRLVSGSVSEHLASLHTEILRKGPENGLCQMGDVAIDWTNTPKKVFYLRYASNQLGNRIY